jgi:hypothetical protein
MSQPSPRNNRLIAFTGSGTGAGKSVLSAFLFSAFENCGKSAHLFTELEGNQLEALQPFMAALGTGEAHAIDAFRAGIRDLVAEWSAHDTVWITDFILPGFLYLVGAYPLTRVEAFADELADLLAPMNPVLVYLTVDIEVGWKRATNDRGPRWRDETADFFVRWQVPYAHYPHGPVRDEADLLHFFSWTDRRCRELLNRFAGETLVLDTTTVPIEATQQKLLDYFRLSR